MDTPTHARGKDSARDFRGTRYISDTIWRTVLKVLENFQFNFLVECIAEIRIIHLFVTHMTCARRF